VAYLFIHRSSWRRAAVARLPHSREATTLTLYQWLGSFPGELTLYGTQRRFQSPAPVSAPVSIREFARLDGCNDKLVRRAISSGKLKVDADGKLDPALVGTGWRKQNRRADTGQMSAPNVRTGVRTKNVRTKPEKVSAPVDADEGADLPDEDQLRTFIADLLAGKFATIAEAERVKENGLALKHMLDGRRKAGQLIERADAERVLFECTRQERDAWMNWPSNVGPIIAADLGIAPEPLIEALTKHVHQQLSDLGEPEPEFAVAE
jgi:hypothetical protein